MFESAIKLIETPMRMQMEDGILKAVKDVGIHVDKGELLRALEYDRGQYDKGYHDGANEVCRRIVSRLIDAGLPFPIEDKDVIYQQAMRDAIKIVREELGE